MKDNSCYVITGGMGFIGANIAHALKQHKLIICDYDSSEKQQNLQGLAYELVHPDKIVAWLKKHGADGVIHMGARSATTDTDKNALYDVNVAFTMQLWQVAKEKGIPFLYASSASIYGDGSKGFADDASKLASYLPLNDYGWSKQQCDLAFYEQDEGNTPWCGLRLFNVYGPREDHKKGQRSVVHQWFGQINTEGVARIFLSGDEAIAEANMTRDFIYVNDVVHAVCWWLKQARPPKGIYNLGSGINTSFYNMALNVFKTMQAAENILWVSMPTHIAIHYQYETKADLQNLHKAGFPAISTVPEEGVKLYWDYFIKTLTSKEKTT